MKGNGTFLLHRVEQIRDDRIFRNILGDVLLGVVGSYLFLVDVFLKDIAEDIGGDFAVVAQRPCVDMPIVLAKKVEELPECLVGNVDTGVLLLQRVELEQAAIEVRHLTEQFLYIGGALRWLLRKTLVEQPQQEVAVEGEKP